MIFAILYILLLALVLLGVKLSLYKSFHEKIFYINSMNNIVILVIAVLAIVTSSDYYLDMAIIYAMLGFVINLLLKLLYKKNIIKKNDNE